MVYIITSWNLIGITLGIFHVYHTIRITRNTKQEDWPYPACQTLHVFHYVAHISVGYQTVNVRDWRMGLILLHQIIAFLVTSPWRHHAQNWKNKIKWNPFNFDSSFHCLINLCEHCWRAYHYIYKTFSQVFGKEGNILPMMMKFALLLVGGNMKTTVAAQ